VSTLVLTAEGEEALRRLNALAAFYERVAARHEVELPERLRVEPRASSDVRTLQETVILRSVTILEPYMTDLARRLVDDHLERIPAADTSLVSLTEHLRDSLIGLDQGRWDDIVTLWSDGLGIAIKQQYSDYGKLVALRTARHAIAHRYGEITAQYRKQHRKRLAEEGFDNPLAAEGPVPLTAADVRSALSLALGTVRWLERRLAAPS
jgi:hypothetical protein